MKVRAIIVLMLFVFICTQTKAQAQHNPFCPMYRWIGEWNMTEIDRKIDPYDEYSRLPRYQRVKYELLEDSISVLSTVYFSIDEYIISVIPTVYFPDLDEAYGFSRYDSNIEVTYSPAYSSYRFEILGSKIEEIHPVGRGKEIYTFKDDAGVIKYVHEVEWYTQDSAILSKQYYRSGKPQKKWPKYTLNRVTKESKLPLPKTPEEIGQHLHNTLKKQFKGMFEFADQFASLESYQYLDEIRTAVVDTFIDQRSLPKTEMERLKFLNYGYYKFMPANDEYSVFWRSTEYISHATFPLTDNGLNDKKDTPLFQVDFRFKYSGENYKIKALYLYVQGSYHLVYIKRKVYQ